MSTILFPPKCLSWKEYVNSYGEYHDGEKVEKKRKKRRKIEEKEEKNRRKEKKSREKNTGRRMDDEHLGLERINKFTFFTVSLHV